MNNTIYTLGHSTRPIQEFLDILQANPINLVVDVRSLPGSRRNPQFNQAELEASLQSARLRYLHLKELGGLRPPSAGLLNAGWKNASFRGFADYMQEEPFRQGLGQLMELEKSERLVILCAEAVPWRCHRSLIADALTVRGVHVEHILDGNTNQPHRLTPFAKVDGLTITYPAEKASPHPLAGAEKKGD